jgi:hypothetical protein
VSTKENLVAAIEDEGLQEAWLLRNVTFPNLPPAGTVEESTRTIAEYCINCNKFLQMFDGIPIIDLLLRGAQRSAASVALVLLSAEKKPDDPA